MEVCSGSYGRWGTVCDKQWSPQHTSVVCRQLGYSDEYGKLNCKHTARKFDIFLQSFMYNNIIYIYYIIL